MKNLFFTLSLIILSFTVFAQESRKGHIGIALGPSFPLGDFADTDIDNSGAGFAQRGLHVNINFTYKISDNFGVAALWTGNAHTVNTNRMADELWAFGFDPSTSWSVASDPWSSGALMGGPLISLPYEKMDLDIKVLFGISSATSPQVNITGRDGTVTLKTTQYASTAVAFGLNLGTGIRYHLNEHIALSANLDYFSTRPEFFIEATSNFGGSNSQNVEQIMNMVNLSFGIGYRIK